MKYLFIGLGSIGKRHLMNLRKITNEPILAYRTNPKKDRDLINKYNVKIYNNYNDALNQKPDAVFITNPTSLHMPYALKAAKQGCHLFIEKSISHNPKDIDRLYALMKKNKAVCYVAFNMRFHPNLIKIKKLINNKKIGKVLFARIEVGQYLPDWHPGENYRKGYAARKDLGGGVVLTLIHELDYPYWLFGKIKSVYARTEKISPLKIDVEDMAAIIAKTEKGTILEIHLDYIQRPMGRTCQIVGDRGKIDWDYLKSEIKLFTGKEKKPKIFKAGKFNRNDMYRDELMHFLRCIKKQEKPEVKYKEVIDVMHIAEAIKRSSKIHKAIKLL